MTISTRVPASRASFSHLVNSGMWRQTSMSAALIASSVPLQRADGLDAHLGPGRHGVDAHLIGVGAEILGRGEGGRHVLAPRGEIAEQRDGLSLLTLQSSNSLRNSIASRRG